MLNGFEQESEALIHQHKKCQLVMALSGFVTCKIADSIWMISANCALWIPTEIAHSIRVSSNAQVCSWLCSVFTWVNYTLDKSANFEGYRYEKLYYDSTTRINSTAHSRAKAMH